MWWTWPAAFETVGVPGPSGELAYHVLDTMSAMDEAISLGQTVAVASTVDPVPGGGRKLGSVRGNP